MTPIFSVHQCVNICPYGVFQGVGKIVEIRITPGAINYLVRYRDQPINVWHREWFNGIELGTTDSEKQNG